jgi:hypothetical protein
MAEFIGINTRWPHFLAEIPIMRIGRILIVLLGLVCAAAVSYWPYASREGPVEEATAAPSQQEPGPVPANRGSDVPDGFRGEVHPLLNGHTKLEVKAQWTTISKGRDKLDEYVPPPVYALFHDVKPAYPTRIYTERDLSVFLPEKIESVGQLWSLDPNKVAAVLRQFQPRPSMHLEAKGRRAGPDGAFGILRAISSDYLDIACRIHTEFNFTPKWFELRPNSPTLWYTPAYLTGRLLVNRKTGTVDYFRLGLPTDKSLNVHLTVFLPPYGEHHDIVRVEHMELEGGDSKVADGTKWDSSLEVPQAQARLTHEFYKFNDIAWVPTDKALEAAHQRQKPIMAMVTWGSLDDQSC